MDRTALSFWQAPSIGGFGEEERERDGDAAAGTLRDFLVRHGIKTLNVAGPRRSQEPGAGGFARETLELWHSNFGL